MRVRLLAVAVLVVIAIAVLFTAWARRDRARTVWQSSQLLHGDASRGRDKIRKYGCYTCHTTHRPHTTPPNPERPSTAHRDRKHRASRHRSCYSLHTTLHIGA